MRAELLIGCGSNREKKLATPGREQWSGLVTLDFNDDHAPNVVHDIASLPLPFPDDSFDEIHAYDVMEHVGRQGDWKFFFAQWSDMWRLLRDRGRFFGISPHWSSPWAWMDPGHTRAFGPECFVFLSQPNYEQVGKSPMTDYRFCYAADFDLIHSEISSNKQFSYVLQAVKPARKV
jgi:SAM-dependent methyltransferase